MREAVIPFARQIPRQELRNSQHSSLIPRDMEARTYVPRRRDGQGVVGEDEEEEKEKVNERRVFSPSSAGCT